jgi:hypothetical protein
MKARFSVNRETSEGAVWSGVATVEDGRVVESGSWRMADGKVVEGKMEMVWGQGEEDGVLTVVQPFAEHEYLLVESDDGFVGQYECGDDMYYVWTQPWSADGWEMRFEVEGPKKGGWQVVEYVPLAS